MIFRLPTSLKVGFDLIVAKRVICGWIFLASVPAMAGLSSSRFVVGKISGFDQSTVTLNTQTGRTIRVYRTSLKTKDIRQGMIVRLYLSAPARALRSTTTTHTYVDFSQSE